ncbi:MAG TPA: RNA-binding cell elongation regulator Jag/EloR [Ktedonobacteraceae bacterium]|nr:RNA-binding cell elongation regulator Jag/EloR [Ktedonobacteraceae bacterium]
MESIEASGKSVDDAVLQALAGLKKRRDEVEVTVLQEPSRGTFGIGNKEARVRVTVRSGSPAAIITPQMADAILGPDEEEYLEEEETSEFDDEEFAGDEEEIFEEGEEFDAEEFEEDELDEEGSISTFTPTRSGKYPSELLSELGNTSAVEGEMQEVETPSNEDVDITVDVLQHILQYMNIRALVQVRSTDPLTLNIQGINENLGLLIGRRGETLSALQLLVSLIVGHRTKHRMRIIIDAENYRERREENLRSLALRVAQQVRNYRRSIALEAMPPHERRIVHIALSDSKDISTESIGEGEARRVVISLKRPVR